MDNLKVWIAFSVGVTAGVAIALLYAPQPGARTRRIIKQKAADAGDYVAGQYDSASEYVKDQASDLTKQASKTYEKTRNAVASYSDDLADNLQNAVKSVKG